MSAHTPEPWVAYDKMPNHGATPPDIEIPMSDYARARVCVDACKGITTEELEHIASTGGMLGPREDVARIAAQRDELLALLREGRNDLAIAASHWNQDDDRTVADFHRNRVLELIKRVDAATGSPT